MIILFIWENDVDTTFYIVKIEKDEKFILRVPPIHKLSKFVQNNQWNSLIEELRKLSSYEVTEYIIIKKAMLFSYLFEDDKEIVISNQSERHLIDQNGKEWFLPKGKVAVNQEVLSEYLRFSHSDAERSFEHQEHIFRLTKIKLLKDKNPLKLQKQLKQLKKATTTSFSIKSL
ncbi:hypothetical protein JQ941_001953, partial [Enterococcus faecalis]|nr:hypothetical protein [Enterococcus faecalis]EHR4369623.1 hypothetical protein [Enterococcus faecalis]EJV6891434.1 hypothetical protein [Enterococcus faecalis]